MWYYRLYIKNPSQISDTQLKTIESLVGKGEEKAVEIVNLKKEVCDMCHAFY